MARSLFTTACSWITTTDHVQKSHPNDNYFPSWSTWSECHFSTLGGLGHLVSFAVAPRGNHLSSLGSNAPGERGCPVSVWACSIETQLSVRHELFARLRYRRRLLQAWPEPAQNPFMRLIYSLWSSACYSRGNGSRRWRSSSIMQVQHPRHPGSSTLVQNFAHSSRR